MVSVCGSHVFGAQLRVALVKRSPNLATSVPHCTNLNVTSFRLHIPIIGVALKLMNRQEYPSGFSFRLAVIPEEAEAALDPQLNPDENLAHR